MRASSPSPEIAESSAPLETGGPSLRRSLALRMALMVALLASLLGGVAYWHFIRPAVAGFAQYRLGLASDLIQARVGTMLEQVAAELDLARERARQGAWSVEAPERFNQEMIPYISRRSLVSSVLLGRDDGREILLLSLGDGRWMNRLSGLPDRPGQIRRNWFYPSGNAPAESRWEASTYDTRNRPWFRGAIELPDERATHWTQPYVFFTTKEPGITVSGRWRDDESRVHVLAFDVLLRDLSAITRSVDISPNGYAAIITGKGEVLAMPRAPGIDDLAVRRLLMQPAERVGVPPLAVAVAEWQRGDRQRLSRLDFEWAGERWIASIRPQSDRQDLWVLAMAPERDIGVPRSVQWIALLAPALLVLGLGTWLVARLAQRLSAPIEHLVAESERIGRQDFTPGPTLPSTWREFRELASAQDRMRSTLLRAHEALSRSQVELEGRVQQRTRDLEIANQELSGFTYSVSHDLKAPLRAIRSFAEIVATEHGAGLDSEGRRLLERVIERAARMQEMIESLLTLSRLARQAVHRETLDLSAIAREVLADLQQQDPERSVAVQIAPDLHAFADPHLTRTLLENLIGNAWKFTGKTAQARIEFGRAAEPDAFEVRDNGSGFELQFASRLFQPFQRMHAEGDFPGTGVGLAIVRRIIDAHGGTIRAEARLDEGARFVFTFGEAAPAEAAA